MFKPKILMRWIHINLGSPTLLSDATLRSLRELQAAIEVLEAEFQPCEALRTSTQGLVSGKISDEKGRESYP